MRNIHFNNGSTQLLINELADLRDKLSYAPVENSASGTKAIPDIKRYSSNKNKQNQADFSFERVNGLFQYSFWISYPKAAIGGGQRVFEPIPTASRKIK